MAAGRARLLTLDPAVKAAAEWAVGWADFYGVPVTIVSAKRSMATQARLRRNFEQCVATGRFPSPPDCKFPANRPGDSAHNFALAWDSVVPPEFMPWWMHVRRVAGFDVRDNDPPHAEYPRWRDFVG